MAIQAAQLIATVSVQGAQAAQGQLLGLGQAADATEARFRSLAVIGSGLVVAGLVAVGVVSAKMAGDFQQAVNRLRTGAGDTQDSFNTLAKGILGVSVATGVMTGPLNKAMYEILSSGQRGAQAFDTLSAAAKGAVIEQANVTDVADTLAGAMTNFGTKTFGAVAYMNGLITAVSRGRITLQDLSTAMGPIEPVAHAMGISFSDLAAAMSTQTNAAIPAARAATGLRFMMQSLEVPTHKAKDAMAAMGLDSVKVAEEMKVSLPAALQMVYNAAKKAGPEGSVPFNRAVSDMVGGQRSLSTFLALTGTHMKAFQDNAKAIADSMRTGANQVQGWAIAQSNFNVIMDRAKAAIAAAAIGFGLLLLPALGRIIAVIPQLVDYFSNFSQHANVLVPVLAGVAAVIAGFLVPAVIALAAGVIAATWPVLAIGAAVAGLVAIFMHFYSTNAGFKAFIDNLVIGFRALWTMIQANFIPTLQRMGAFFQGTILPILQQVGSFLVATFRPVWQQLAQVWNGQILPALKQLWAALQPLMPLFKLIGAVILGVVVIAFGLLVGVLAGVIKAIAGFIGGLATVIGGIVQIFSGMIGIVSGAVALITHLLTGNFSALGNDLRTIWNGIVTMFTGVWNVIKGIFQAAWGAISGLVSGFVQAVIGFFQHLASALVGHSIVPDMINAIVAFFAQLPGRVLGFIASLVSGVISRFASMAASAIARVASMISSIVGFFAGLPGRVIGLIASLASGVIAHFAIMAASAISRVASMASSIISSFTNMAGRAIGLIASMAGSVIGRVAGMVGSVIGQFGSMAGAAIGRAAAMVGGIIGVLSSLPGRAAGIISSMAGAVLGRLYALAGAAYSAGANIVSSIASGIQSMVGAVIGAAQNVASAVASFLPHSPAKVGPLRDLEYMGTQIPEQLATGMKKNVPALSASLTTMLSPLVALPAMTPSASHGPIIVNVHVNPDIRLDGAPVAKKLMPHIATAIRQATGAKL